MDLQCHIHMCYRAERVNPADNYINQQSDDHPAPAAPLTPHLPLIQWWEEVVYHCQLTSPPHLLKERETYR